jgi:hypothetical protein
MEMSRLGSDFGRYVPKNRGPFPYYKRVQVGHGTGLENMKTRKILLPAGKLEQFAFDPGCSEVTTPAELFRLSVVVA